MKLEKQLKADAAVMLDKLVVDIKSQADRLAKVAGLTGDTLCRLAVGTRVESIRKSAINKIAYKKGEQLYVRYTQDKTEVQK